MAVNIERINVTDVPVLVLGGDAGDQYGGKACVVKNATAVPVDLVEASGSAFGSGYELLPGEAMNVELEKGESIYAVAGSAGPHTSLHVIQVGVAA